MAETMEAVLDPPTQGSPRLPAREAATPFDRSFYPPIPDLSHIITEDDEPVDNIFSDIQQRLLVEPLYSSWQSEEPFMAHANVGVFAELYGSPLVPDMFLSMGVESPQEDIWKKENRSYFIWMFGKPPDVVVEVVSNREGGEAERKVRAYARMGVPYYVIYDPQQVIQSEALVIYQLVAGRYIARSDNYLPEVGLSLQLWDGEYEGHSDLWLRWADEQGVLIPTGGELAYRQRQLAEKERERADKLAARLRELGIDPAEIQ